MINSFLQIFRNNCLIHLIIKNLPKYLIPKLEKNNSTNKIIKNTLSIKVDFEQF